MSALSDIVAKFRKGSPNIAAAFDEVERILNEHDARLDALETAEPPPPPPPPTGVQPPVGPFREETGDHFYRDGDGLTTEKLYVTSAPGYGIANMRWPYQGASTGIWNVRDCKVKDVGAGYGGPPGTGQCGLWVGEKSVVERVDISRCTWMGMVTLAACTGSTFTDLNIHDCPHVGLYMEHVSRDLTFTRCRFGFPDQGVVGDAASLNVEWWYEDSIYTQAMGLPYGGKAGSYNCKFIDCEFYCPPVPTGHAKPYEVAGAFLDAGTFGFEFHRPVFKGPGDNALGHPRNMVDASRPNKVIDPVFERTSMRVYQHDNGIG